MGPSSPTMGPSSPVHNGCVLMRVSSLSSSAAASRCLRRRRCRLLCARRSARASTAASSSSSFVSSTAVVSGLTVIPALDRTDLPLTSAPSSAAAAVRPADGSANSSTANPRLSLPSSRFFRWSTRGPDPQSGTPMDTGAGDAGSMRASAANRYRSTSAGSSKKSRLPT